MSDNFERVRDQDESEDDRADPEEPASWTPDTSPTGVEVDAADWADQQVSIDDSPFDEDATS